MTQTFLFGERVKKTENNHGWKILYDSREKNPRLDPTTLLSGKSVIVLPGDGTHSARTANGSCKAIQNMLFQSGLSKDKMPHIYGIAYLDRTQPEHRYQILTQLNQTKFGAEFAQKESPNLPYYQVFFNEYILPLMVNEKGNPHSVTEIQHNLQNITFVSHCHGGFLGYQIEKMMAEKLIEIYPQEMKSLMGNVRMIHFSSRRPKGQLSLAKHFDIISQNDTEYADTAYLEYDDIHQQIQRSPLQAPSTLVSLTSNETILIMKKITTRGSEDIDQDEEHSQILSIFSGQQKNLCAENTQAIQLTQQILRHFVENPGDKKSMQEQIKRLNPEFFDENFEQGNSFLEDEKRQGKIRRSILSLLVDLGKKWGLILTHREKIYRPVSGKKILDRSKNDFLRQRDENGNFLFEELIKQYKKTGDSRSLSAYIEDVGVFAIPLKHRGNLALSSIQNNDWSLFNVLNVKKGRFFYVQPEQLPKIISTVSSQHLYRLLGILQTNEVELKKQPETIALLIKKIKEVQNPTHKKQLESFYKTILQSINYCNKDTLKALLKRSSIKGKKSIKSLLSNVRQEQAVRLLKGRNKIAPQSSIKESRKCNIER